MCISALSPLVLTFSWLRRADTHFPGDFNEHVVKEIWDPVRFVTYFQHHLSNIFIREKKKDRHNRGTSPL